MTSLRKRYSRLPRWLSGKESAEVRREGRKPLPDHAGESPLLSRSGGVEMRPSSIAPNPAESREALPTPQHPSPLRGTLRVPYSPLKIQPSHPLSSLSPPAPNPSQHQGTQRGHHVEMTADFRVIHGRAEECQECRQTPEAWEGPGKTLSHGLRRTQPCPHLDLALAVSRTRRPHASVVRTT